MISNAEQVAILRQTVMRLRKERDDARNLCRIQRRLICDIERERHDAMCRVKELEKDIAEGVSCD